MTEETKKTRMRLTPKQKMRVIRDQVARDEQKLWKRVQAAQAALEAAQAEHKECEEQLQDLNVSTGYHAEQQAIAKANEALMPAEEG